MKINTKPCLDENCEKQAISFSKFCGEHCDNEQVLKAIKNISGEEPNTLSPDIYISDIDIVDITIKANGNSNEKN